MAMINSTFSCLLFSIFIPCITRATEDPELQLCKKQCRLQAPFDEWQQRVCQHQCEECARLKEEIEKEAAASREEHERQVEHCKHQCRSSQLSERERQECERRCEEHHGEGWKEDEERGEGPEEKLEHCKHQCRSQEKDRHGQQQCRRKCEELYQEEREGRGKRALLKLVASVNVRKGFWELSS